MNDSIEVLGGRDDKLISILANKLNFKYTYVDPPERSQGSSFNTNGTFEGVLGLIWSRVIFKKFFETSKQILCFD